MIFFVKSRCCIITFFCSFSFCNKLCFPSRCRCDQDLKVTQVSDFHRVSTSRSCKYLSVFLAETKGDGEHLSPPPASPAADVSPPSSPHPNLSLSASPKSQRHSSSARSRHKSKYERPPQGGLSWLEVGLVLLVVTLVSLSLSLAVELLAHNGWLSPEAHLSIGTLAIIGACPCFLPRSFVCC